MRNREHFRDWFIHPVLEELREVGLSLYAFRQELRTLMNDFTVLQKDLDAIKTGVADLLAKVAALQGTNDQATIDALAAEAQGILDAMNPPAPPTPPAAP